MEVDLDGRVRFRVVATGHRGHFSVAFRVYRLTLCCRLGLESGHADKEWSQYASVEVHDLGLL